MDRQTVPDKMAGVRGRADMAWRRESLAREEADPGRMRMLEQVSRVFSLQ